MMSERCSESFQILLSPFHSTFLSVSEDTAIPVSLDGQRLILANGTLVLRSVKAEDSGYYTCTATNTLGFDTIIVNLLVQGRKSELISGRLNTRQFCFAACWEYVLVF